jgi:hypothetical protein
MDEDEKNFQDFIESILEDNEELKEEKPVDHRLSIGCEQIDHRDER